MKDMSQFQRFKPPHKQFGFWGTVLKLGASYLASKKGGGGGRAADANKSRLDKIQGDIAQRQDVRAGFMFDRYKGTYVPLEDKLISEVMDNPIDPNVQASLAAADVERQAVNQRGMDERRLARVGVDPTSGAAIAGVRARGLGEVTAKAGASTTARRSARTENFGRLRDVIGMGRGLPASANMFSSSAAGTYGRLSGAANEEQRYQRNLAYDTGTSFGDSLTDLIGGLGTWFKKKPSTSSYDYSKPYGTPGAPPGPPVGG